MFSIFTLVEETQPVVAHKDDFECRDNSKLVPCFGNFGVKKLWCNKKDLPVGHDPQLSYSQYGLSWKMTSPYLRRYKIFIFEILLYEEHLLGCRTVSFQMHGGKLTAIWSRMFHSQKTLGCVLDKINETCCFGWNMRLSLKFVENF